MSDSITINGKEVEFLRNIGYLISGLTDLQNLVGITRIIIEESKEVL